MSSPNSQLKTRTKQKNKMSSSKRAKTVASEAPTYEQREQMRAKAREDRRLKYMELRTMGELQDYVLNNVEHRVNMRPAKVESASPFYRDSEDRRGEGTLPKTKALGMVDFDVQLLERAKALYLSEHPEALESVLAKEAELQSEKEKVLVKIEEYAKLESQLDKLRADLEATCGHYAVFNMLECYKRGEEFEVSEYGGGLIQTLRRAVESKDSANSHKAFMEMIAKTQKHKGRKKTKIEDLRYGYI
jgi:hypothetical protein